MTLTQAQFPFDPQKQSRADGLAELRRKMVRDLELFLSRALKHKGEARWILRRPSGGPERRGPAGERVSAVA